MPRSLGSPARDNVRAGPPAPGPHLTCTALALPTGLAASKHHPAGPTPPVYPIYVVVVPSSPLRADLATKYLTSLYWAFTTIATVGYGDITPKTSKEKVGGTSGPDRWGLLVHGRSTGSAGEVL